MSIPVELPDLQAKTAEYTWAYLLTVRPDATPHLVSLSTQWDDGTGLGAVAGAGAGAGAGAVADGGAGAGAGGGAGGAGAGADAGGDGAGPGLLMSVSAGTARNASACLQVTLCYPPLDHDGYSLIVDGIATPFEGEPPAHIDPIPDGKVLLRFEPSGAVLHRSAAPGFSNSATGCANDCLPVNAPAD